MSVYIYYIIFAVIMLFALVATIMIGNSNQNKEGNPQYDKKTAGNWTRLTSFYVIAAIIGVIILLLIIFK